MRVLLRLFEVIKGDKEYSCTWQTHGPWSYTSFSEDLLKSTCDMNKHISSSTMRCWGVLVRELPTGDGPGWPRRANFDRIVMLWIVIAISIITWLGEMNESMYFFEQLEQCLVTDKTHQVLTIPIIGKAEGLCDVLAECTLWQPEI